MKARQFHKFDAYRATLHLLEKAPADHGIVVLPSRIARLRANVEEIDELGRTQTTSTKSTTTQSTLMMQEMVDAALAVAAALTVFAADHDAPGLRLIADVSERDFHRLRKINRHTLAGRILEAAQSVADRLVPYGVTAATLADLRARVEGAGAAAILPRNAQVRKQAATKRLREVIAETDALLRDQIDRLIYPLRKTHGGFYAAYQSARRVRRSPHRSAEAAPANAAAGS